MNTPMAKPDEPLEILRTIHSFDPCLACASHVISPDGEEITRVTDPLSREALMSTQDSKLFPVYVWEVPVRIWHWVMALCMVVLAITGYLIGTPPRLGRRRGQRAFPVRLHPLRPLRGGLPVRRDVRAAGGLGLHGQPLRARALHRCR